jgi:hypothetical protein
MQEFAASNLTNPVTLAPAHEALRGIVRAKPVEVFDALSGGYSTKMVDAHKLMAGVVDDLPSGIFTTQRIASPIAFMFTAQLKIAFAATHMESEAVQALVVQLTEQESHLGTRLQVMANACLEDVSSLGFVLMKGVAESIDRLDRLMARHADRSMTDETTLNLITVMQWLGAHSHSAISHPPLMALVRDGVVRLNGQPPMLGKASLMKRFINLSTESALIINALESDSYSPPTKLSMITHLPEEAVNDDIFEHLYQLLSDCLQNGTCETSAINRLRQWPSKVLLLWRRLCKSSAFLELERRYQKEGWSAAVLGEIEREWTLVMDAYSDLTISTLPTLKDEEAFEVIRGAMLFQYLLGAPLLKLVCAYAKEHPSFTCSFVREYPPYVSYHVYAHLPDDERAAACLLPWATSLADELHQSASNVELHSRICDAAIHPSRPRLFAAVWAELMKRKHLDPKFVNAFETFSPRIDPNWLVKLSNMQPCTDIPSAKIKSLSAHMIKTADLDARTQFMLRITHAINSKRSLPRDQCETFFAAYPSMALKCWLDVSETPTDGNVLKRLLDTFKTLVLIPIKRSLHMWPRMQPNISHLAEAFRNIDLPPSRASCNHMVTLCERYDQQRRIEEDLVKTVKRFLRVAHDANLKKVAKQIEAGVEQQEEPQTFDEFCRTQLTLRSDCARCKVSMDRECVLDRRNFMEQMKPVGANGMPLTTSSCMDSSLARCCSLWDHGLVLTDTSKELVRRAQKRKISVRAKEASDILQNAIRDEWGVDPLGLQPHYKVRLFSNDNRPVFRDGTPAAPGSKTEQSRIRGVYTGLVLVPEEE